MMAWPAEATVARETANVVRRPFAFDQDTTGGIMTALGSPLATTPFIE